MAGTFLVPQISPALSDSVIQKPAKELRGLLADGAHNCAMGEPGLANEAAEGRLPSPAKEPPIKSRPTWAAFCCGFSCHLYSDRSFIT